MPENKIIRVDEADRVIGTAGKLEAHREGWLHRAFSVIIFNSKGEVLLQKRATGKYHSGGLWSNACCSHPRPGQELKAAAEARLFEELGFACTLQYVGKFTYRVDFANALTEHEIDNVFYGRYDGPVSPDLSEVESYRWVTLDLLREDLKNHPERYTFWLPLVMVCYEEWRIKSKIQGDGPIKMSP